MQTALRRDRTHSPRGTAGPMLSVVVPVFNEIESLPELRRRLDAALAVLGVDHEFVFVDDGSTDGSAEYLEAWAARDPWVRVRRFSRNFGHQAAVSAGLESAEGDAVAILDGDLQDPPELLDAMLERWREGYDVAYAVRKGRKEGPLRRAGYFAFYRLLRGVAGIDLPLDSGDCCLMDRQVVDAINRLPEKDRFLRGLRAFVGFRQIGVPYERAGRMAGRSKYTLSKLCSLAVTGFVNFVEFPVRGLAMFAGLLGLGAIAALVAGSNLAALILALASANWLTLALLGAYVARIFAEVKGRPAYIVRDTETRSAREARNAA